MKHLIIAICLFINSAYAQISLSQSSPDLNWKEIESSHFKIVYPDYIEDQAHFTLNLLEHYKKAVAETYDQNPKKLTLILRSELSMPNGFVTLAPRRSEWFTSSNITPVVGSLDWFQSLAIHEYRHVIQLDYLNRSNIKNGYYLFGENIANVLMFIVMPTWYFEGDAVWTETVLSDGGRGRSPRFSARFKALLSQGNLPKYDSLLAGDYTQDLPNHYVFGYFLITHAQKVFGKKVWKEVAAIASDSPLNPFSFYNAFEAVTGTSFSRFYENTLNDLKSKWPKSTLPEKQEYSKVYSPQKIEKGLLYLQKTFDSHWELTLDTGTNNKIIKKLSIYPSLSKSDANNDSFLFTHLKPHSRYGHKSSNDLHVINLNNSKLKRLTYNKRLFHPEFSPDNKSILAIEYTKKNEWTLNVLDLTGKLKQQIQSQEDMKIAEASWIDNKTVIALTLNNIGKKQFTIIDLETSKFKTLTKPTRNNIYNIKASNDHVYFEADDKGQTNIFSFHLKKGIVAKCTNEEISAQQPSIANDTLYFTSEDLNGSHIKNITLQCEENSYDLFDIEEYIGNTPSDSYFEMAPLVLDNSKKFMTKSISSKEYDEYEHGLTPHSWSFFGGRGYQLSAQTSNYLNSFNLYSSIGLSSEENKPFAELALIYSKYYPIFVFDLQYAQRITESEIYDDPEWDELKAGLGILLPYINTYNLYNLSSYINLNSSYVQISENEAASLDELNNENLIQTGYDLMISLTKTIKKREINPEYGFIFSHSYKDFKSNQDLRSKSFVTTNLLQNFFPGFFMNHSLAISIKNELRPANLLKYHTQENYVPTPGYTFSRGYNYSFTPNFTKATLEYTLPLTYPNTGFGKWIHFTRVYATLFYDHTYSEFIEGTRSFNSRGIEFYLESLTFRKLPLKYGIRLLNKQRENEDHVEFFLSL